MSVTPSENGSPRKLEIFVSFVPRRMSATYTCSQVSDGRKEESTVGKNKTHTERSGSERSPDTASCAGEVAPSTVVAPSHVRRVG